MERAYIAIDLKSFYASVECRERELDPLTTCLVVADASRTEKTICLAVSPALKAYGIPGRARLFEVVRRAKEINGERLRSAPGHAFSGRSADAAELAEDPSLELDFITAVPRMALYIEYSTRIYSIYLKYVAPEDIHVYSLDEVFIDVTEYLNTYRMTARELAVTMIRDVLKETGITATAGIGTNLYLAKVAMDIVAKHAEADADGVRIAELDEMSYRRRLWSHRPLTDFWRVGRGYARKLEENGMYTMGDIARCSLGKDTDLHNEELLYRLFGVNAELLIDHAWGCEPCTIDLVRQYRPESSSVSSGQVLMSPYSCEKAAVIVQEMADALALELVEKRLAADQVVLTVAYDRECLTDPEIRKKYRGPVTKDYYGRSVPKPAHGTENLSSPTSSGREITQAAMAVFRRAVDPELLIRYITVTLNHVIREEDIKEETFEQLELFKDYAAEEAKREETKNERGKERRLQEAMLEIRKRYGTDAILRGLNFQEGATGRERAKQIGGHKA